MQIFAICYSAFFIHQFYLAERATLAARPPSACRRRVHLLVRIRRGRERRQHHSRLPLLVLLGIVDDVGLPIGPVHRDHFRPEAANPADDSGERADQELDEEMRRPVGKNGEQPKNRRRDEKEESRQAADHQALQHSHFAPRRCAVGVDSGRFDHCEMRIKDLDNFSRISEKQKDKTEIVCYVNQQQNASNKQTLCRPFHDVRGQEQFAH